MKRKREAIEEGGKDEKKRSKDVSGETRKGKDWREEGGEARGGMEREEGSRREEKERGGGRGLLRRERGEVVGSEPGHRVSQSRGLGQDAMLADGC